MEKFTADTIVNRYKEPHIAVCTHYGFETTNVVHIAQQQLMKKNGTPPQR